MGEEDLSSAPVAQFIGYTSRKGRQGAKDAKVKKRVFFCLIIVKLSGFILFNENLSNNNSSPFFLFPLRALRPLRLCERNSNGTAP